MNTKHLIALLTFCLSLSLIGAGDPVDQDATGAAVKSPVAAEAAKTAPAAAPEEEEAEMTISADRMEMQMDQHVIELTGNVLIEDSTMKLTAQKMTVFLDNDNKMEHIEAEGGVTVRKLDSSESAVGDRGDYDAKADVIVLTGNCTILQGKNAMKGDKVVYDRKNQKINLHGATVTIPLRKGDGDTGKGAMGNLFGGGNQDDKTAAPDQNPENNGKNAPEQKPAENRKGDGK
ncbi:MAG: lipopolysaccharide transport periplasmic protein LptA [Lentisphaeria bacterium]|nr:lipopolysaccharide transport periplasmic protein LptA [Lentisphaeria bacterium]